MPTPISRLRYAKQAADQQFAPWVMLHVKSNPADLHPAADADQGQAHLMTVFQGAVDATFAAFGIDAIYTPAGGDRSGTSHCAASGHHRRPRRDPNPSGDDNLRPAGERNREPASVGAGSD